MKAFIALVCLVIAGAAVAQNSDEPRCKKIEEELHDLLVRSSDLKTAEGDAAQVEGRARASLGTLNKAIADYQESGQNYREFISDYWATPEEKKRFFENQMGGWKKEYELYHEDRLLKIVRDKIILYVQACAADTADLLKKKAAVDKQYDEQWNQYTALGCNRSVDANSWPPGVPKTFGTPAPRESPEESPFAMPSPATADNVNQVTVPNFSVFNTVSEMKAVLNHAGLIGAFAVSSQAPPAKDKEFKFAGQDPAPDTKVAPGTTVTISIYPRYGASVIVPDLSVFDGVSEMKAVLSHAGLVGAFVAAGDKPPSKDKEFKYAGQDPAPDAVVDPQATVTVSIYQKFGEDAQGTVPNVVGLTLDQAQKTLAAAGLDVGGITDLGRPSSAEKANKIANQDPAAGANIPDNKLVSLKQYGSFKESTSSPEEPRSEGAVDFAGTWVCTAVDTRGPATYIIEHAGDGYSVAVKDSKGGSQPLEHVRVEGGQLIGEAKFDLAAALGGAASSALGAGLGGNNNAENSSRTAPSNDDTTLIVKFTSQGNGLLVESSLAANGKTMPMERRPAQRAP